MSRKAKRDGKVRVLNHRKQEVAGIAAGEAAWVDEWLAEHIVEVLKAGSYVAASFMGPVEAHGSRELAARAEEREREAEWNRLRGQLEALEKDNRRLRDKVRKLEDGVES